MTIQTKTIVLRVGGSSLYERTALPIVGGFIAGVTLSSLLGIITGDVRFFKTNSRKLKTKKHIRNNPSVIIYQ